MKSPVFISMEMTGKLKGMNSISTNPQTNEFCQKMRKCSDNICSSCYAFRSVGMYKNSREAYQRNSGLLSSRILSDDELPFLNTILFRFNSFGEIINENNFINYCNIAKKNKRTTFGWWTKRIDLVNQLHHLIPPNVIMIYSEPKKNQVKLNVPQHFDKVFAVYNKENITNDKVKINCGIIGKCIDCQLCYKKTGPKHIKEKIK